MVPTNNHFLVRYHHNSDRKKETYMASSAVETVSDRELVSWWGLVIEGFHRTNALITGDVARKTGISAAQAEVLLRLGRTAGHRMSMTQIAREVSLTSGGFTKVADKLCGQDLMARARRGTDRRIIYAELTPNGVEVSEQLEALTAQVLRERLVGVLGSDDAKNLAATMQVLRDTSTGGATR